jgi:oligopeptide transport system substrate-binding protein
VLRIAIGAEPDNVDPQKASFVGEIQWIMLNYQALMTFDTNMKPIPGAAEKVDVSPDGKTYTFTLRDGLRYSNGDPLTAANFEYAWKRLADPELAGDYQFIACDIIKGYSEYAATTCQGKTLTETLELDLATLRDEVGVTAIDDKTLQIELVNPAPYFLSIAALWVGVPTREEDAANGDLLSQGVPENFIGNGPFKLVEHEYDVKVVFEANENYVGPLTTQLKRIEMSVIKESQVAFQAYKNGELEYIGLAPEDRAAAESDPVLSQELRDTTGSCTFYLGFNNNKPPFDNQQVRAAFAQAIDREAWVRDVFQGLGSPTQTFIPPGFPGYEATDQYAFNPEAAKAALAKAGFPNGEGLPEIKLTFSSSARNKVRFEWFAGQFQKNLGINVTLDPVDPTAYTALVKDPATLPQMFYLGWCADFPDPQNWLTAVFKTGGSAAARVGFSNEEFDALVTQADAETDPARRAELYSQAQKLLIEIAPVAFLSNDGGKLLVKPYVKLGKETPIDYIPGYFDLPNLSVEP